MNKELIIEQLKNQGYTIINDMIYYVDLQTNIQKLVGEIVKDNDDYTIIFKDRLVIVNKVDYTIPFTLICYGENIQEELNRGNKYYKENYKNVLETSKKYSNIYSEEDIQKYKDKAETRCEIMLYSEFEKFKRDNILSKPLKEITENKYNEMLNVLPPLHYVTRNGITMFCMCEMYTESYTNQYAYDSKNNKYYTKLVDVKDESTWINNILNENKGE